MEIELNAERGIRAWFTDEDGSCILNIPLGNENLDNPDYILPCMVPELCDYVDRLVELQEAQISSTESYVEVGSRVKHTFLVLGLQRETSARLRLERLRARNTSAVVAVMPFVETEANDRAMFTITGDVAQPGRRQNLQKFEQNPTLRDLRVMLRIVCDRLGGYKAWPKNCWLFSSVIQQLLGYHRGGFELGTLQKRYLGKKLRTLILIDYSIFLCNARSAQQSHVSPQHEAHSSHHAPASQSSPIAQNPLQPAPSGSPIIVKVHPNTWPVAGVDKVAVLGSNFPQSSRCFFGSEEAEIMQREEGWLWCIPPQSMEPGSVDVIIQVDDLVVTSPQSFTYKDTHRHGS